MTSTPPTRLERALELFVAHQQSGGDWQQLLRQHADLADLLQSFREDDGEPAGDGDAFGDFRLVRELGRGGAGVVWEVRQQSLDRRVALKVLHDAVAASPAVLLRFRREAQTLARLDHAGIVRVLAVGEHGGRHWFAMDFVDGESLGARLERLRRDGGHRGDSLRRLVEIVADVAGALQYAHQAGIVHRDVKPSNVLLRRDGSAVLGDFGLARGGSDPAVTQTGVVAGTPHYMAPEQIAGGAVDARTDVFALGATLYECLTLQRAFDGPTTQAVLQRILLADVVDPRRRQRGLPRDLTAIALKALEKDPARRYATAQAFADDLHAFLELRPISASPPTHTRRLLRLLRRQPVWAALLVLAIGAAVLGAVLLARLPDLQAAAQARSVQRYEDAIAGAMLARGRGDRDGAERCVRRALDERPASSEAAVLSALCALRFDGAAAALAEFERRVGADAADQDVQRMRALLLRRVQRTDAAAAIERRLDPPATPIALLLAAVVCVEGGTPAAVAEARGLLSLAVRIAPQPRLMLTLQWAVLTDFTDFAARREAAATVLSLWPDHPLALEVGASLLTRVDPQRSIELGRKAMALGPASGLTALNLAVTLLQSKDRAGALAAARQAIDLGLPMEAGWGALVDLLADLDDEDGVARALARWQVDHPDSVSLLRQRSQFEARRDELAEAERLLDVALAKAPDDANAHYELAIVRIWREQPDGAVDALRTALRLAPRHAKAHERLVAVLSDLLDVDGVRRELERWVEVVPEDAAAWADLARAYLQQAGPEPVKLALAAAERADALAQGRSAAYLELRATACERLGDHAVARWLRERAQAQTSGPPTAERPR